VTGRRRRSEPPRLAESLLTLCVPAAKRDAVVGDMSEAFERRHETMAGTGLRRWYWSQALSVGGHYLLRRVLLRVGRRRRRNDQREGRGMATHDLGTDIRLAFRTFAKAPGFTLASVLVLALGLGAVTFMFSTLDAVALRPLPFPEPDRLVWAWSSSDQNPRNSISLENYTDYRDQVEGFESLAAFLAFRPPVVITGGGEPERAVSTYVTANLFPTLGVSPAVGRGFTVADGRPGADAVVVLSHDVWMRRFGGDPSAVGAALAVDGRPFEVVGVMPEGFDYPGDVDLWLPSRADEWYARGRDNSNYLVVGRLRDGVSLGQAQVQADVVARQLQAAYPDSNTGWRVHLVPLHERYFGGVRQALVVLLGLVTLVLLTACANVASLALARATTRTREVAIRIAMGARRGRVVRQLLTEYLVVALAGGAVGLLLAWLGIRALRAWGPSDLPRLDTVGLDSKALLFAVVLATATGLLFGTWPALRGSAISLSETLKAGSRSVARAGTRGRSALVVAQVALSLVLMISSGLLLRSFLELQEVDVGFDPDDLLLAEIQVAPGAYPERDAAQQAWDAIQGRLAGLPGVRMVGGTDQLPIGDGGSWNGVYAQGREPERTSDYLPAQRRYITEGFLESLGLPLLEGRTFRTTDDRTSALVTVMNTSMARALWPGESALGRYVVLPWDPPIPLEVVGVVGDVLDQGPGAPPRPTFYLPIRQNPGGLATMRFLMRTSGDPMATASSLREAVWSVDPDLPVSGIHTMSDRLAASVNQPRFRATMVALFASSALLLAALGLYALLAFAVRRRTHEIAVRLAMGAGSTRLVFFVLGQGMRLVGLGVGLGLAGSLLGGRVLQSFLFGVPPSDPATLISVTIAMLTVAMMASLLPARRALKVAPLEALNTE